MPVRGVSGEGCDNLPPPCEQIQVAIVCAGPDASRTVVTLVKSRVCMYSIVRQTRPGRGCSGAVLTVITVHSF